MAEPPETEIIGYSIVFIILLTYKVKATKSPLLSSNLKTLLLSEKDKILLALGTTVDRVNVLFLKQVKVKSLHLDYQGLSDHLFFVLFMF